MVNVWGPLGSFSLSKPLVEEIVASAFIVKTRVARVFKNCSWRDGQISSKL